MPSTGMWVLEAVNHAVSVMKDCRARRCCRHYFWRVLGGDTCGRRRCYSNERLCASVKMLGNSDSEVMDDYIHVHAKAASGL